MKLTQGTNLHSTIFTAVLHSNTPSTYFYFGNKGSWNIVEIVTYAFGLYFSTKEKELSHDNCYFGNKGSWNIVEIVTYAFGLYFSTKEKELSHDNCFRSFSYFILSPYFKIKVYI